MKFQFSIREMLLIAAIAALAAGWWIDHQRINRLAVLQWEYKIVWTYDMQVELDKLGVDGWELCGSPADRGTAMTGLYLKRPMR
jgi:hypothetical protein